MLPWYGRRSSQLARSNLVVLCFQLVNDIQRRELIFVHRVAVQPDAHCILGTEQLHVTDAGSTADRIFYVRSDIVGDIILREIFIVRHKACNQQEAAAGFLHANPLLLHFLRQQRHGELEFVLNLHLRDIRIRTRLERQRNGDVTGGITGGRHVHQIIDTVHVLFDNLSYGVLYRLGISARVGCCHRNRRGRNGRILRDGQF